MKFLTIDKNDQQLFSSKFFTSDFIVQNLPKFRRMYEEQGSVFWLHFLCSLRESMYDHFLEYMKDVLSQRFEFCLYYCLISIENALIRLHKYFIENQYESAKAFIKVYCKFHRYLKEEPQQMELIALHESFSYLFGNIVQHDKCLNLQLYRRLTILVYGKFYNGLCELLRRYTVAPDQTEPQQQYWFHELSNSCLNPHQVVKFNQYLAKYWKEKFSTLVPATSSSSQLSLQKVHNCHLDIFKSCDKSKYVLRARQCEIHKDCKEIITHDKCCKEPFICQSGPTCRTTCENVSRERRSKFVHNSKYWAKFEAKVHPGCDEYHRNVNTLAQCYDFAVETYVVDCCDPYDKSLPPPWYMSPEVRNMFNQNRRKEETVARLREKLEKKICCTKSSEAIKPEKPQIKTFGTNESDSWKRLYKKAAKKFDFELLKEKRVFKHEFIKGLSGLPFLKGFPFLNSSNEPISSSVECANGTSVAVGYDEHIMNIYSADRERTTSLLTGGIVKNPFWKLELNEMIDSLIGRKSSRDNLKPSKTKSDNCKNESKNVHQVATVPKQKKLFSNKGSAKDSQTQTSDKKLDDRCCSNTNDITNDHNECNISAKDKISKGVMTSDKLNNSNAKDCNKEIIPQNLHTTVSQKLDVIEKSVKENGGLDYDAFMLMLQAGEQLVKDKTTEQKKDNVTVNKVLKKEKGIHFCGYCNKQETETKFKKCAQCKAENFPIHRYYCSRDCQTEDWKERHREEHIHNNLKV